MPSIKCDCGSRVPVTQLLSEPGEPKPTTPLANVERSPLPTQEHFDWLKKDCSRLMHGQCTTARCLKRGGYVGPESDYGTAVNRATCEPYEIHQALFNTRSSDASTIEDAVEQEQGRWQGAIREKVITASQIPNADSWVDGAGCDSGDPLDVSLTEIGQVINHFVDELAELRADAGKEAERSEEDAIIERDHLSDLIQHLDEAAGFDGEYKAVIGSHVVDEDFMCERITTVLKNVSKEYIEGLEDVARLIKNLKPTGENVYFGNCQTEAMRIIHTLISQHSPQNQE